MCLDPKVNKPTGCNIIKPIIKDKCTPKPCVQKNCFKSPVAGSEYGYLTGDPHLRGGDGELYDIMPLPGTIYSVLKDKNLNYNAKMDTINDWGACGVTESAITVSGRNSKSVVTFNKDGVATLTTKIKGKTTSQAIEKGQTYTLADGGTVKFDQALGGGTDGNSLEERLIITTKEGYIITQAAREKGYIDSNVETPAKGVKTDGVMPSGILGDTFDKDSTQRTATDDKGSGVLNHNLNYYQGNKLSFLG